MTDLIYEPANDLGPLKAGDRVEVVNREGMTISTQVVKRVGSLVVTTRCGRQWTRSHGEWVSELRGRSAVSWPFPSIRKAPVAEEPSHA